MSQPVGRGSDQQNATELDVVNGRAVGLLTHYGSAGAGWWVWRALSATEAALLSSEAPVRGPWRVNEWPKHG